jgi:hypothetical protein
MNEYLLRATEDQLTFAISELVCYLDYDLWKEMDAEDSTITFEELLGVFLESLAIDRP